VRWRKDDARSTQRYPRECVYATGKISRFRSDHSKARQRAKCRPAISGKHSICVEYAPIMSTRFVLCRCRTSKLQTRHNRLSIPDIVTHKVQWHASRHDGRTFSRDHIRGNSSRACHSFGKISNYRFQFLVLFLALKFWSPLIIITWHQTENTVLSESLLRLVREHLRSHWIFYLGMLFCLWQNCKCERWADKNGETSFKALRVNDQNRHTRCM